MLLLIILDLSYIEGQGRADAAQLALDPDDLICDLLEILSDILNKGAEANKVVVWGGTQVDLVASAGKKQGKH